MAKAQLDFSGVNNIIDPTKDVAQGLESAKNALNDVMKQGLVEKELAKQEARQKMLDDRQKLSDDRQEARQVVLDDRAKKEYDYTLTERDKAETEAKQKQSYLNSLSSPGDMFKSKAVQEKLMSPDVMAQMVANNPVLTKAYEQGLASLTPQEKVKYENHFKQMEKLGAMPTKKMEILDAADLYGIIGGEYATTQSIEAKKALELARNTGLAEVNKQRTEMSIAQLKEARSGAQRDPRSSEYAGSKNAFGVKVVSPMDVMKDAQSYLEKVYAEDGKGGKLAKPINTLTQLMANNGYDAAQTIAVVDAGYKPSTKWGFGLFGNDAELKTPTMSELNSLVGAPRNVARNVTTSTGYSVSDRAYDKQVAGISKKYLDEAQSKIENRGVHKPTEELFNRILNNTYGDESKTAAKKPLSREIEKPVKVSEAISAKREEKLLPKPVYSKDTANTYAADMQAYGKQQKRLALESEADIKKIPKENTSTNLREFLSSSKPLAKFPDRTNLSPGALNIFRQLNPTGMTAQEKAYADLVAEDQPLEDMSLSLVPGLKAANKTATQLNTLIKAGYTRAEAEALIRTGYLKLLPAKPSQINVPRGGFQRANKVYDISMPAMKP